jgi:hypothetical protein
MPGQRTQAVQALEEPDTRFVPAGFVCHSRRTDMFTADVFHTDVDEVPVQTDLPKHRSTARMPPRPDSSCVSELSSVKGLSYGATIRGPRLTQGSAQHSIRYGEYETQRRCSAARASQQGLHRDQGPSECTPLSLRNLRPREQTSPNCTQAARSEGPSSSALSRTEAPDNHHEPDSHRSRRRLMSTTQNMSPSEASGPFSPNAWPPVQPVNIAYVNMPSPPPLFTVESDISGDNIDVAHKENVEDLAARSSSLVAPRTQLPSSMGTDETYDEISNLSCMCGATNGNEEPSEGEGLGVVTAVHHMGMELTAGGVLRETASAKIAESMLDTHGDIRELRTRLASGSSLSAAGRCNAELMHRWQGSVHGVGADRLVEGGVAIEANEWQSGHVQLEVSVGINCEADAWQGEVQAGESAPKAASRELQAAADVCNALSMSIPGVTDSWLEACASGLSSAAAISIARGRGSNGLVNMPDTDVPAKHYTNSRSLNSMPFAPAATELQYKPPAHAAIGRAGHRSMLSRENRSKGNSRSRAAIGHKEEGRTTSKISKATIRSATSTKHGTRPSVKGSTPSAGNGIADSCQLCYPSSNSVAGTAYKDAIKPRPRSQTPLMNSTCVAKHGVATSSGKGRPPVTGFAGAASDAIDNPKRGIRQPSKNAVAQKADDADAAWHGVPAHSTSHHHAVKRSSKATTATILQDPVGDSQGTGFSEGFGRAHATKSHLQDVLEILGWDATDGNRHDSGEKANCDVPGSHALEEPQVMCWSGSELSMHKESLEVAWAQESKSLEGCGKTIMGAVDGDLSVWDWDGSAGTGSAEPKLRAGRQGKRGP